MMNAIIACAVVNAVAVRSDPQIKAHGGNVAVSLALDLNSSSRGVTAG